MLREHRAKRFAADQVHVQVRHFLTAMRAAVDDQPVTVGGDAFPACEIAGDADHVADQHGVLPHSMSAIIRNKSNEQLTPREAVLRVFSFHERMSPEEHRNVRTLLERVVRETGTGAP